MVTIASIKWSKKIINNKQYEETAFITFHQ